MPKRKDQWYAKKATTLLTHAMWHCKFGSEPDNSIRMPDEGDIAAETILLERIREVEREGIERDIIEGRT